MRPRLFLLCLALLALLVAPLAGVNAQEESMEEATAFPAALLQSTDMSGAPEGQEPEAWMNAAGIAFFDMGMEGSDTITFVAVGLVPDGLYTLWWVNNMEDEASMSMGPAGGTPANEFIADKTGKAVASFEVASDNDYQTLVVAYHADGETHGETPGEMGVQTFAHLMGAFPGPASIDSLGYATLLDAIAMDGTPEAQDAEAWLEAGGLAYVAPVADMENVAVTVVLGSLVPEGLYTFWWVNDMEDMAVMSMGPAGGTPANEFTADENGSAVVTFEVPANNNYQTLVVAYHADGETHGEMPGEMGVQTFGHLMGAFPHAIMMDEGM